MGADFFRPFFISVNNRPMPRYKIITLIDITRTNALRSETDQKKLKQQNNFDSLRQAIELRANVYWDQDPKKDTGRLPDSIDGRASHWKWEFEVEQEDLFSDGTDPLALLKQDLHGVPIIADLENSVDIEPAAIQTKGKNINTWITII
jgi:hypothetical protein